MIAGQRRNSLMKQILMLIPVLMLLLVSLCGSSTAESDAAFETAAEAALNMKVGWNLGNTLEATGDWIPQYTAGTNEDYETAWGNPVTPQSLFPKLKGMGISSVRIPVTWHYHFDEEGNIDPVWMNRVKEIVDWALDAELYVIINVHHDNGADGWMRASESNYATSGPLFIRLWEQIAETFQDYPQTLLFEGFNELLDDNSEWNEPGDEALRWTNQYNQDFVNTVRATGGNNALRNLICNTYAAAASGNCLPAFILPEDSIPDHLLAGVHCYVPWAFITDEELSWTAPVTEYGVSQRIEVINYFTRVEKNLIERGMPVIIGEFGTTDKNNTAERLKWYTEVATQSRKIGAPCFIWDNGHTFNMGLIDRVGDDDDFPELVEACAAVYE